MTSLLATIGESSVAAPTRTTGLGTSAIGHRILVADDNELNRQFAIVILEKAGYRVDAVSNGVEAVKAVVRGQFDAVLMDGEMPVMDGYAAAAEIRRREGGVIGIPIIALTASVLESDTKRALVSGMDVHISKPINRAKILLALTQLLTDRGSAVGRTRHDVTRATDREIAEGLRQLEVAIGPDAYGAVCAIFLRTGPNQIVELREALTAGDAVVTKRLAHRMKGTLAIFGAVHLTRMLADIEENPELGPGRVGVVVAELEREFTRVENLLSVSAANT